MRTPASSLQYFLHSAEWSFFSDLTTTSPDALQWLPLFRPFNVMAESFLIWPMLASVACVVFFPHPMTLSFFNLFIYLYLVAVGLCCCTWAFSSCSKWGLLSSCIAQVSHCCGFSCGAQALGTWTSVIAACRLSSWNV